AKAKEMKPFSEKMITKAKKKNLASIRLLKKRLSKQAAKELFDRVAPAVKKRKGGYIRIIRKGWRESDGAEMALVLLVDFSEALEAGVSTDKKDKIKNKKNKQSIKDNEKQ
ncbi:50S ribosomal protein L17, partial [Patescibacteria group bacterium]|nr:50S ribosomal protein L17 [Patescibacteria group bacterium]